MKRLPRICATIIMMGFGLTAQTAISQVWTNLGSGMDCKVYALAFDTNGHLYAGGRFEYAGGVLIADAGIWGGADSTPVPGDYDENGKSDPAVYRDGCWSIANGIILVDAGPWGGPGWTPVR